MRPASLVPLAFLGLLSCAALSCGRTVPEECGSPVVGDPNGGIVAVAGQDRTAVAGRPVALNGSASHTASPGAVLDFTWALVSVPDGSFAVLSDPKVVNPSFVPDVPGSYAVRLVVSDGCRQSAPSVTVIRATTESTSPVQNRAPVAHAGPNRSTQLGLAVVLDGTGSSDPDGDTLTFAWTIVKRPASSTAFLQSSTSMRPSLKPDVAGAYTIALVVSDGELQSEPAMVTVNAQSGQGNREPVANAGPDQAVKVNATVVLNGSASSDPDGDALNYQWSFVSRPPGSSALLGGATTQAPSFLADKAGTFVVRLIVSDGSLPSPADTVNVVVSPPVVTNSPPVANAGVDQTVGVGATVQLSGAGSSDPDGDPLTWSWTIATKPGGSTATLSAAGSVNAHFVADKAGSYVVALVVSDGKVSSTSDTVAITATATVNPGPVAMLNHRVVDAEYSRALERIVTVSESPNALHVYDPVAKTTATVPLNLPPTAVGVGPTGLLAAVGHNGWISYVNLQTLTLIDTLPVTCDVIDIVLGGNGWVYAFPRIDQWEHIRSVNLTTRQESLSTGYSIRAGTLVRAHPNGTAIYGADNGLSPSDIEKYSIANGNAAMLYDSPYHGTYPMCGDLWISEDGARIFTRCGNVFWSSSTPAQDMVYAGALPGVSNIRSLSHSTPAAEVALVPGNGWNQSGNDTKVRLYNAAYLTFSGEVTLPAVQVGAQSHATHGRWIFHRSNGSDLYVIVQLATSSGAALDFGVVTL